MALIPLNLRPSALQVRLFGHLWLPLIFLFLAAKSYSRSPYLAGSFLLLAVAFELATRFAPATVKRILVAVSILFYPVSWAASYLLITLLYFVLLCPIALVVRLLRKDPLKLIPDPMAKSYWIARKSPVARSRYFRQY